MVTWEAKEFSLEAIAASGQVFTWQPQSGIRSQWRITSGKRVCMASQAEDKLCLRWPDKKQPSEEELRYWRHYFALDDNYAAMLAELEASGLLPSELRSTSRGIRVLHQQWFDVAVSFIISQNSNISRIQRTMDVLIAHGDPPGSMPSVSRLIEIINNPAICNDLRLGYRRPYLLELAQRTAAGWRPLALSHPFAPLETQMAELERLPGIGPKVASCICLYGLGYDEAVPRDVWIKRAEHDFDIQWHPRLGGIQQQLVFTWIRDKYKRGRKQPSCSKPKKL